MKRYNFTLRIFRGDCTTSLNDMTDITISNITLIKKRYKHEKPFIVDSNSKKFDYNISIKGKFEKFGGSHNYPTITFKGNYIDIIIRNFPRYPVFTQDSNAAKWALKGWGYTNYINQGYPVYLLYRDIKILNLNYN